MVRRRWRLACRRASRVGFRKSASRGVISSAIRGAGTAVSLAAVTGLIRTNLQTHICRPVETIQWRKGERGTYDEEVSGVILYLTDHVTCIGDRCGGGRRLLHSTISLTRIGVPSYKGVIEFQYLQLPRNYAPTLATREVEAKEVATLHPTMHILSMGGTPGWGLCLLQHKTWYGKKTMLEIVSTSDNEDKAHEKPASLKEGQDKLREEHEQDKAYSQIRIRRGEGFLRSVRGSGRKLEGRVEKGEARKVFGGREGKGREGKVTLGPTTFPWAHRRRITDNSRAYCISPIRPIHGEAVVCA
ncbi:hypothetical protein B296_00011404 [Ensete ventricosum]|uniref:Uncharacterized protein n=1 Tax=Ensete ventricosum TaxID=4639 RepID=A0A427AIH7_ENSVE|nr:hypothetical protein B296_00011404 [Ensete ventricosum]